MVRMLNQAKLKSFRTSPRYKYGFQVPKDHEEAMMLDQRNGNTKWEDAEQLELSVLDEHNTFTDLGRGRSPPTGYKCIKVWMIYDIKHDGRHKARLVAGGHLTDVPVESVYSSVVSLKGLRAIIFIAELNKMQLWGTDVTSAYLLSTTKEKVCIIAGPEFKGREKHLLLIHKALYGLRSSGKRYSEFFADIMRDMGFSKSRADNDIWMRRCGNSYEYIATYVDDLCIASHNPAAIIKTLEEVYLLKLKGTGELKFHLGCDFYRDAEGVLCMIPRKFIERTAEAYTKLFGVPPKHASSPLEKGDHPELDTSDELPPEDIKKYQSLIGSLQWLVSLGRLDIATAVMTMSGFRVAPRVGHMNRVKRICGYLMKFKHGAIRFRIGMPDYSDIPTPQYDWSYTTYGKVKEVVPDDLPTPLGLAVLFTTYVDANLYHDLLTGRSVSGVLHLINQTPYEYYTKKQNTVATATYGAEFMAARIACDQIVENRMMFRYLGVPLTEKVYLFGDNRSVVDSSVIPHGKLHKRHTALSFHRVREIIASGIVVFTFIKGKLNPADILTKHWGHADVWEFLQPLMFWQGDTMNLFFDRERST